MRVEILIKRVSMRGVPVASPSQVTAALEGELTRLFSQHGAPESLAQDLHLRRVRAMPVSVSTAAGADARMGRGLARGVYHSLRGGEWPAAGAAPANDSSAKTS